MGLRGQRLLDQDSAAAAGAEPGTWRLKVQFQFRGNFENKYTNILTEGVTGKGGILREKLSNAESAVGAASPKVRALPALLSLHAVLGSFYSVGVGVLLL
jgi:hypothetical protein